MKYKVLFNDLSLVCWYESYQTGKLGKVCILSVALAAIKIWKTVFDAGSGSKGGENNNQGKDKWPKLNSFLGSFDYPCILNPVWQSIRLRHLAWPRRTIANDSWRDFTSRCVSKFREDAKLFFAAFKSCSPSIFSKIKVSFVQSKLMMESNFFTVTVFSYFLNILSRNISF